MCTVTVIPLAQSADQSSRSPRVRLVCNRDEQRSRPMAEPPVPRTLGARTAIMPIDPPSRGTWIGANDAGIIACLINTNRGVHDHRRSCAAPSASRGVIVPSLLEAESLRKAFDTAHALDASQFPPFRLLVIDAESFFVVESDGQSLKPAEPQPLRGPIFMTSSGLGDHLVEHVRARAFHGFLFEETDPLVAQERFHTHRWSDNPAVSVLMSRSDARTVCRTVIDLTDDAVTLSHTNLSNELTPAAPPSRLELPVRTIEVGA